MSESTLAALAAIGAPLLKEAEAALAPEAERVLVDLREFVSGEADKLRTQFPAVVDQGVAHLHNLAEAMLSRYNAVMDRIDGHLTGAVGPSDPTTPPSDGSSTTSEAPSAGTTATDTPAV